jgi:CheY-like chemotaxis protein
VKESARLRGVPVLLLAGAFEPVDQERVRKLGCDGVLVKPFEPQQLVNRVKTLLQKAAAPAMTQEPSNPYEHGRRYEGDLATVTPFPGTGRAASHLSSPTLVEPEPLEPPIRPVWEGAPTPGPGKVEKVEPVSTPARVSLANAFSALLAAEQMAQPAPTASASPAPSVSDESVEQAVRRVLGRMTDEHVRSIVTEVAERLVREEIEKIKAKPE